MIERCGDRQRKFDGLQKWPFHLFIESLPVVLQVALLLLACGLCRHVASINTSVASVLIALTALGVLFYLVIVVSGTSSYACPFQTPASTSLRSLWKKIRPQTTLPIRPVLATSAHVFRVVSSSVLRPFWKEVVCPIVFAIHRSTGPLCKRFLTSTFGFALCSDLGRMSTTHHPRSRRKRYERIRMHPQNLTLHLTATILLPTDPTPQPSALIHRTTTPTLRPRKPAPHPRTPLRPLRGTSNHGWCGRV